MTVAKMTKQQYEYAKARLEALRRAEWSELEKKATPTITTPPVTAETFLAGIKKGTIKLKAHLEGTHVLSSGSVLGAVFTAEFPTNALRRDEKLYKQLTDEFNVRWTEIMDEFMLSDADAALDTIMSLDTKTYTDFTRRSARSR